MKFSLSNLKAVMKIRYYIRMYFKTIKLYKCIVFNRNTLGVIRWYSFLINTCFVFSYMENWFLKILFIFRKRGREGERMGEKHQCVVAYCAHPIGDLAHNPGMCPHWELNQRPFVIGQCSIHWATPVRADNWFLRVKKYSFAKTKKCSLSVWIKSSIIILNPTKEQEYSFCANPGHLRSSAKTDLNIK